MTTTRSKSSELENIIDQKLSSLASKENIAELKSLILEQKETILSLRDQLSKQENDISKMNDKIAILSNTVDVLRKNQDNQEQYSRRYCLRMNGIKKNQDENESSDVCINKVVKVCQNLNLDIKNEDIDRAHRIGRDRKTIMIKFHSFRKRTLVYKERKKASDSIKIYLDLTQERLKLLDDAKALITNESNEDFIFCPINCNTVAKLKNNNFKFFDSLDKFKEILSL